MENERYKYCRFFKGEATCPEEYQHTYKQMVWASERVLSKRDFESQEELDKNLCAHICTWNPYKAQDFIKQLYQDYPAPGYQNRIMKTYEVK